MHKVNQVSLHGGRVTLLQGDSLNLLAAGLLDCDAVVSDPPYGIGYTHGGNPARVSNNPSAARPRTHTAPICGDDQPFDPAPWIAHASRTRARSIPKNGGAAPLIVLWGADHFMQRLPAGGSLLAWDKHLGYGPDDSFADCEWAWCGRPTKREVFRHLWKGVACKKDAEDRMSTGAWRRLHVSQKPVAAMRWCIEKLKLPPNSLILDPYMGSGSTGVAALSLGHRFSGVEVDSDIFGTACQRLAEVEA